MDVVCDCGVKAVVRTSWTNRNPGRRFWGCKNFLDGNCGFFVWKDPPMCARSTEVIPGLLRTIRLNDAGRQRQRLRENVLLGLLLFTWVVVLIVWLCMEDSNNLGSKGVDELKELGF